MNAPLVVEVVRSGAVESRHLLDVVVLDRDGSLVASAGDRDVIAAFRSSAKPLQCRVALDAGWQPADDRAIAIACASHNGEAEHVAAARAVLAQAGIREQALRCPADVPAYPAGRHGVTQPEPIFHNCSGKHASMLAACAANGWPLDDYRAPDHPLQARNRAFMSECLGAEPAMLVDGCGVPTFTSPLRGLARAFGAIDDGGPESRAMRAHPFLVAGSERTDTDVMTAAPHVLMKSGAEGLTCASAGGYAIAMKARDGDLRGRARGPAIVHVLRALAILDDEALRALALHAEPPVLGGGVQVGSVRVTAPLQMR